MNTIKWTSKAVRQAQKIKDSAQRKAIFDGVCMLADFPNVPNVKRLTDSTIAYRLRIGNWRVLFDFDGTVRVVTIEEVKKRNERTY